MKPKTRNISWGAQSPQRAGLSVQPPLSPGAEFADCYTWVSVFSCDFTRGILRGSRRALDLLDLQPTQYEYEELLKQLDSSRHCGREAVSSISVLPAVAAGQTQRCKATSTLWMRSVFWVCDWLTCCRVPTQPQTGPPVSAQRLPCASCKHQDRSRGNLFTLVGSGNFLLGDAS